MSTNIYKGVLHVTVMNAIQSVLSILVMVTIGYVLALKGWLDDKTTNLFSKLLIKIAIPCMLFSNVMTNFDKEKLLQSGPGLLIAFISIAISYAASVAVSRLLKISLKRRGTFQAMFTFSNTMFIGLPVNLAIFGVQSVPYALLYFLANAVLFWTIGVHNISRDDLSSNERMFSFKTIKMVMSPPIIGTLVALFFMMLNIRVPAFLMDTCQYMGSLSTPISMLFIGSIIFSMGIKGIILDKDAIALMAGRFIITPMLVIFFFRLYPVDDLMRKVLVIQSAMPVLTQSAIASKAYNGDYKYASAMVTLTTGASLVFIPLYVYLLTII